MPLPNLLAGVAVTMLTAGLIHQRRQRLNTPAPESDNAAAGRAMRTRIRLAHLIRAIGVQRLGAWQHELKGFTDCVESITHLRSSEVRLHLDESLKVPSALEREVIRENAMRISTRDLGVQADAAAAVQEEHHATAAILAELGMTERVLRERLSRMERRRMSSRGASLASRPSSRSSTAWRIPSARPSRPSASCSPAKTTTPFATTSPPEMG